MRDSVSICAAESHSLEIHVEKIRFLDVFSNVRTYLLGWMIRVGEGVVVVGRGRVGNWYYTAVSSPFVTLSLCNSRWDR